MILDNKKEIVKKIEEADGVLIGASNGLSITEGLHLFADNQAFEELFWDLKQKYGIQCILQGMGAIGFHHRHEPLVGRVPGHARQLALLDEPDVRLDSAGLLHERVVHEPPVREEDMDVPCPQGLPHGISAVDDCSLAFGRRAPQFLSHYCGSALTLRAKGRTEKRRSSMKEVIWLWPVKRQRIVMRRALFPS